MRLQLDISLEPCTDRDIAVEGSEKLWFHIKVDRQDTQPLVIDLQTPRDQQEAHTKVRNNGKKGLPASYRNKGLLRLFPFMPLI